jgi:hypothetical protein
LDEKNNHTPRQSSNFHRVLSTERTEFAAMGYTNSVPGQFALEISAKLALALLLVFPTLSAGSPLAFCAPFLNLP